jgi:predicted nucleic acid-binding protein
VYVLDSDVFSLYFVRENPSPPLKYRIESTPYEQLWITPINVEESIRGALKLIQQYNEAKDDSRARLTFAYDLLLKVKLALSKPQILPFDDKAYAEYAKIPRGLEKTVKTGDCRIAAIAVSRDYTVITKNIRDYARIQTAIPVKFLDWSDASADDTL